MTITMQIASWNEDDGPSKYDVERIQKAVESGLGRVHARTGCDAYSAGHNGEATYTLVSHVTAEGCVIATRERNGYDDSDFYAIFWNEEKGEIDSREYASTRGWTHNNHATVDVTEETMELARAWKAAQLAKGLEFYHKRQAGERPAIKVGDDVFVSNPRARKVSFGESARVFWAGPNQYGSGTCLGLEYADGRRVFTVETNCYLTGATSTILTDADREGFRKRAEADSIRWGVNHLGLDYARQHAAPGFAVI